MLSTGNTTYRQGGVYVVIGGSGGIGEVWTRWMIEHYQANVIWIGRREKNDDIKAKINSFGSDRPPQNISKQMLQIWTPYKKLIILLNQNILKLMVLFILL